MIYVCLHCMIVEPPIGKVPPCYACGRTMEPYYSESERTQPTTEEMESMAKSSGCKGQKPC